MEDQIASPEKASVSVRRFKVPRGDVKEAASPQLIERKGGE